MSWASLLRQAYQRALRQDGSMLSNIVRPVVAESWERSERAHVMPDDRPPIVLDREACASVMRGHLLAPLLELVETVLVEVARYAHQVVALADAEGMILWTDGHPAALEAAERIHLRPGVLWSEEATGTNAIGIALGLDHPVQIFSAEHYKEVLHGWSSAAAPIRDPETETTLGAVGLFGPVKAAHPHGFSLVAATAQMVEARLSHDAAQRDDRLRVEYLEHLQATGPADSAIINRTGRVLLSSPSGWLGSRMQMDDDGMPVAPSSLDVMVESLQGGDGFLVTRIDEAEGAPPRPTLRLEALGRDRVEGSLGKRSITFTPRHGEILVILAEHPEGLDEQALSAALHGTVVKEVTVRAEISRLRRLLGPILKTRPYRLTADVSTDFADLEALVERGEGEIAAQRYPGPLLPSSRAPAVVAARERIDAALDCVRSG